MNLRQLEAFYAIMQAGSVTAAARALNVTQPAVSNVLRHAEQQLGFKLFERIGGRLHPTAEANQLLPDVNEIFGRVGTLNRIVNEMRGGKTGRLVIASSPTLVHALLPHSIALFRRGSPAIQVSIQSLPTPLVVERVARREVDMGIAYAPTADPAVDAEDVGATEIACVVPLGHPLARKRRIGAQDLGAEAVISLGSTTRLGMLIDDACRKAHIAAPSIAVEASSSLAACLLVSEGAGIALVDRATSMSGKFGDLAFRPFTPQSRVSVQLLYPRDRPRPRAAVRLAEHIRRMARTHLR